MNKENNSHYYTLGLQPGASPSEIKSAFRRLMKLYHADKDQSLDAEMKYKEISIAYKMLIDKHVASKAKTANSNFSSKQTTWTSEGSQNQQAENGQGHTFSKQATWNPQEWSMENDFADKRISLKKLLLTMLGSIPLLTIDAPRYVIIGLMLVLAAFFLVFYFEKNAIFESYTADRMYFWFTFTISAGFSNFVASSSLIYYFFLIILCILGLFMPLNILTKDPRFPSQW